MVVVVRWVWGLDKKLGLGRSYNLNLSERDALFGAWRVIAWCLGVWHYVWYTEDVLYG